jgi:HD-GYP domain-containing protein (c-di-GMP phosphodiesterase class II)
VVDNWDELTSDRPNREPWSADKTAKYQKEQCGKKFDTKIVDVFLTRDIRPTTEN